MTIKKHIRRDHPYVGSTFQEQAELILGKPNCIIKGGEIDEPDPSATPREIIISEFTASIGGIIVSVERPDAALMVQFAPQSGTSGGRQYLLLSTPDDRESSGVVWRVADSEGDIQPNELLFAVREQLSNTHDGRGSSAAWTHPTRVSVSAGADGAKETHPGVYSVNAESEGFSFRIEHATGVSVAAGAGTDAETSVIVSSGHVAGSTSFISFAGSESVGRFPLEAAHATSIRTDSIVAGPIYDTEDHWFRATSGEGSEHGADHTPTISVITGFPSDPKDSVLTSFGHLELATSALPVGEPKGGQGALAASSASWSDGTDGTYTRNHAYNQFKVAWLADAGGAEYIHIAVMDQDAMTHGIHHTVLGTVADATRKDFSMTSVTTGSAVLVYTATDGGREKLYLSRSTTPTGSTPAPTTLDLEDVLLVDNTDPTLSAVYATSDIRRPKILSNERDEIIVLFEATSSGAANNLEVLWAIKVDRDTGAVVSGPSRVSDSTGGHATRFVDAVWTSDGTIVCGALRDVSATPNLNYGEAVAIDFDVGDFERVEDPLAADTVLSDYTRMAMYRGGVLNYFEGYPPSIPSTSATSVSAVLLQDGLPGIVFTVDPNGPSVASSLHTPSHVLLYAGTAGQSHFGRSYRIRHTVAEGSGPADCLRLGVSADMRHSKGTVALSDGLGFQLYTPGGTISLSQIGLRYSRFNLELLFRKAMPFPISSGMEALSALSTDIPEKLAVARAAAGDVAIATLGVDSGGDFRVLISLASGCPGELRFLPKGMVLLGQVNVPSVEMQTTSGDRPIVNSTGRRDVPPTELTVSSRGGSGHLTGADGITQAIDALKGVGGTIRIKDGRYVFNRPIELHSGIHLSLDSGAVLTQITPQAPMFLIKGHSTALSHIDGNIFSCPAPGIDIASSGFSVGDLISGTAYSSAVEPIGQEPVYITEVMSNPSTGPYTVRLSTANPTVQGYARTLNKTNIKISGGTIETQLLLYGARIASLSISGATILSDGSIPVPGHFEVKFCRDIRVENCTFTKSDPNPAYRGLLFSKNYAYSRGTVFSGNTVTGYGGDASLSFGNRQVMVFRTKCWDVKILDNTFHRCLSGIGLYAGTSGAVEGNSFTEPNPAGFGAGHLHLQAPSEFKVGRNKFVGIFDHGEHPSTQFNSIHGAEFQQVDIARNLNVSGLINGGYYDAAIQALQFVVSDILGFGYFSMIDGITEDYEDFDDLTFPTGVSAAAPDFVELYPGTAINYSGFESSTLFPIGSDYRSGFTDSIGPVSNDSLTRGMAKVMSWQYASVAHTGAKGSLGSIRGVVGHQDITAGASTNVKGYLDRDAVAIMADLAGEGGGSQYISSNPQLAGYGGNNGPWHGQVWTPMEPPVGSYEVIEDGGWYETSDAAVFSSNLHFDKHLSANAGSIFGHYSTYGRVFVAAEPTGQYSWIRNKIVAAWTDPTTRRIVIVRQLFSAMDDGFNSPHFANKPWRIFLNAQVINSLTGEILGDTNFPLGFGGASPTGVGAPHILESPIAMGMQLVDNSGHPDRANWSVGWLGDVVIKPNLTNPDDGTCYIFVAAGTVANSTYWPASGPSAMTQIDQAFPGPSLSRVMVMKLKTDVTTWGVGLDSRWETINAAGYVPENGDKVNVLYEVPPTYSVGTHMFGAPGAGNERRDDAPIIPALSVTHAKYVFNNQTTLPAGTINTSNNYLVTWAEPAWVASHDPIGKADWKVKGRIYYCDNNSMANDGIPLNDAVLLGAVNNVFVSGRHLSSVEWGHSAGGQHPSAGATVDVDPPTVATSPHLTNPAGNNWMGFRASSATGANQSEHHKMLSKSTAAANESINNSTFGPILGDGIGFESRALCRWPRRSLQVGITDDGGTHATPYTTGKKRIFVSLLVATSSMDCTTTRYDFANDWSGTTDHAPGAEFTQANITDRVPVTQVYGEVMFGLHTQFFRSTHDDAFRDFSAWSKRTGPATNEGILTLTTWNTDPALPPRAGTASILIAASGLRPLRNFMAAGRDGEYVGVPEMRVIWQGRGNGSWPSTMSWNYARAMESSAGAIGWITSPTAGSSEYVTPEEIEAGSLAWLDHWDSTSMYGAPEEMEWDPTPTGSSPNGKGLNYIVGWEEHEALFWIDDNNFTESPLIAGNDTSTSGVPYYYNPPDSPDPVERMIYFSSPIPGSPIPLYDQGDNPLTAHLRSVAKHVYVKLNYETTVSAGFSFAAAVPRELKVIGGGKTYPTDGSGALKTGIRIFPQVQNAKPPTGPPTPQVIEAYDLNRDDYDTTAGVNVSFGADVENTTAFVSDWTAIPELTGTLASASMTGVNSLRFIPWGPGSIGESTFPASLNWYPGGTLLWVKDGTASQLLSVPDEMIWAVGAGDYLRISNSTDTSTHRVTFVGRASSALGNANVFYSVWPPVNFSPSGTPTNNTIQVAKMPQGYLIAAQDDGGGNVIYPERVFLRKASLNVFAPGYAQSIAYDTSPAAPTTSIVATIRITDPNSVLHEDYIAGGATLGAYMDLKVSRDNGVRFDSVIVSTLDGTANPIYLSATPLGGWDFIVRGTFMWPSPLLNPGNELIYKVIWTNVGADAGLMLNDISISWD